MAGEERRSVIDELDDGQRTSVIDKFDACGYVQIRFLDAKWSLHTVL